ncbi:MAG: rRNA pseudouridine synthase [Candidatus Nanopelagicales bacterium]|mgnify:FL=1|nr:rRNA pseudouridine synthase [Candidatus Nanopelagicales bacterium]MDP4907346.1 rRNA pseudouridine synthase [Candidatus Nanopelagicales bacterium]MDP4976032.1 rRNA pseudouridine synthase [Candidatus Nanopelagicales bacterium]
MADEGIRLQKVLASAGIGSRRACEELIDAGRVSVDGRVVREQGMRVDPARSVIHVDGERVPTASDLIVLALNKPFGVLSTMNDEQGRPCVGDLVADRTERLFHVGRLDADTEGLLLLTNDGELAQRLTHPSHGVMKTYLATVPGIVKRDVGRRLREGIELEDGLASVDSFRVVQALPGRALVELTIHEGRKHVVRRLLEAVDHPVEQLVRTQVGPIPLGELRPGRLRAITGPELGSLYTAAGL